MSSKNARELRKVKRDFLLSFFSDSGEYAELEVNGFWLVKQWNGDLKFWQAAIYTKETFEKYKGGTNGYS